MTAPIRKYHDTDVLHWDGLRLHLNTGRLLATVEPDATWPKMYRVRLPDDRLTDMVNLSRAKDAAVALAMAALNSDIRQTPVAAPPVRYLESGVTQTSSVAA